MAGGGSGLEPSLDDPEVVEQGSFTEPNIVPLVDIMMVLLVILMASSTAIVDPGQGEGSGIRVQLPTASASEEISSISDQLVVAVLAAGEVVVRGEQVSLQELERIFVEEAEISKSRLVLVQADESALHKRVVQVMETARKAGLSNLAIATKPAE